MPASAGEPELPELLLLLDELLAALDDMGRPEELLLDNVGRPEELLLEEVAGPEELGLSEVAGPEELGLNDVAGLEELGLNDVAGPEELGLNDVAGLVELGLSDVAGLAELPLEEPTSTELDPVTPEVLLAPPEPGGTVVPLELAAVGAEVDWLAPPPLAEDVVLEPQAAPYKSPPLRAPLRKTAHAVRVQLTQPTRGGRE